MHPFDSPLALFLYFLALAGGFATLGLTAAFLFWLLGRKP